MANIDVSKMTLPNDANVYYFRDIGAVRKTGDSMSGCLYIQSGNSSYAEGIRINRGNGNYCTLTMGAAANTSSGTGDNVWWLGCNPVSQSHKWFVAHNGSTASKTYWYVNSSSQVSPNLRVSGEVMVGSTSTDSEGCKLQYNTTTQSIDFVFT